MRQMGEKSIEYITMLPITFIFNLLIVLATKYYCPIWLFLDGHKLTDSKEKPQLKSLKPGLVVDDLITIVCDEFNCEPEMIIQKGLKNNEARDLAIYLCRQMTSMSGVSLGRYFGGISGSAITNRYNNIKNRLEKNRKLKRQISTIRRRIMNN